MSETDVTAALSRIRDRYRVRFAGHARVSRDTEELDELIAELDELAPRASSDQADAIRTERELYGREIDAIKSAQAVPFALPASRLRMWADFHLHRYQWSFAGQDRRTRDVALLEEIRTELHRISTDMSALHAQAPEQKLDESVAAIERARSLYLTETEAIRTVRRTGSLGEQGSRLAELANAQFERYKDHFAGQSRNSRHVSTLLRILSSLDEIRRAMGSLKLAGLVDENNTRNIAIIEDRTAQYRREVEAINAATGTASIAERVSALGTAANTIFATYRTEFAGKSRESRDSAALVTLSEKLVDIAREMDKLDRDHDDEGNARNLRVVTDHLHIHMREHEAIRTARAGKVH